MNLIKRIIVLIFVSSVTTIAFSQQQIDTINLVLGLHKLGLYKEAKTILAEYRIAHPEDVNVEWLYGQSAFFSGDVKHMIRIYEANIALHADNYFLQLDYAFKLTDAGKLEKAKRLLETHLQGNTRNAKIYEYLAKISYWQSDYNTAQEYIKKALELSPESPEIKKLNADIKIAKALWLDVQFRYFQDNQPLSIIAPNITTGKYVNAYLVPSISYTSQMLDTSGNLLYTNQIKISNTSFFAKSGLVVKTNIGIFSFPNKKSKTTALVGIDKTFLKYFTFSAQAERKPYIPMLSSLDTTLMTNDFWFGLYYGKPSGFMGQIAYMSSLFDDGNSISTAMAWVVSPALKLWKFNIHAGYGFGYTSSKRDTYSSIKSEEELFLDIYFDSNIAGQFSPYMTPMNQEVHSVVGVVSFTPFDFLQLTFSGNYGFKAKIETPYLYGYYDADFSVVVEREYYTEHFKPFELKADASIAIAKKMNLHIEYRHSNPNYYYKTDYLEVGLKINFADGK